MPDRKQPIVPPRRTPRANEAAAGFVYVIARGDGASKVGVSRNPKRRLSQLAISSPDTLVLARSIRCGAPAAFHVEQGVKVMLESVRLRGEWFRVSPELAAFAIECAKSGSLEDRAYVAAVLELRRLTEAWEIANRNAAIERRSRDFEHKAELENRREDTWAALRAFEDMIRARFASQIERHKPANSWGVIL